MYIYIYIHTHRTYPEHLREPLTEADPQRVPGAIGDFGVVTGDLPFEEPDSKNRVSGLGLGVYGFNDSGDLVGTGLGCRMCWLEGLGLRAWVAIL